MKRIIVIGAGAAGMIAAISAARCGALVTLLEGKEKPGKKLLITGSGRCNLTNLSMNVEKAYRGSDVPYVKGILEQFPVKDTMTFFEEAGLRLYDRDGYVYPVTGQAQSVLNVLLFELRRLMVKIKCSEKAVSVKKESGIFKVSTESWTYEADAVILTAGSMSAPATGSDGSGYALAAQLGHHIIRPLPGLTPMLIKEGWIKKLGGVRMPAGISLITSRGTFFESGELQWTDYGISGIAVFGLSSLAAKELNGQNRVSVTLDLLPFDEGDQFLKWALAHKEGRRYEDLLTGIFPAKAIAPLLDSWKKTKGPSADPDDGAIRELVSYLKKIPLTVTGVRGFEHAQVCTGGVDTAETKKETLESRICPGLYLAGEILDVDGICGGYNLQWAWSSGWVAGKGAASE